jgi:hypothetical protein
MTRFPGMPRLLAAAIALAAVPAAGATFTVTSTADSGPGSLRQAILGANAHPGSHRIVFAIPGAGVHTIAPVSALPAVTQPVTIDGYTQPGSRPNDLPDADDAVILVDLSGAHAASGQIALEVDHDGCTIRGLAIHGFQPVNQSGGGDGLFVDANDCVIVGNFVGTDASGLVADGNTEGITVRGNSNRVGGLAPGDRNLIAASINAVGLRVGGNGNVVEGNFIGVDATGAGNVGNHGPGIVVGGQGDTIGGTTPAAANVIGFNGGAVVVPDGGTTGVAIVRNSIFGPGTNARGVGGIDLAYDGVTPNDACDGDAGTNHLQNYPVLTSATSRDGAVDVGFTLNSAPSALFRVEFFASPECDNSGFGPGKYFLGAANVTTGAGCEAAATVHLPVCLDGELVITATATNIARETSEFSACLPLTVAPGTSCRVIVPVDPPEPKKVRPRT